MPLTCAKCALSGSLLTLDFIIFYQNTMNLVNKCHEYNINVYSISVYSINFNIIYMILTEAVVQRRSVKKVFLKILQNSQESTCAKVSFLIKL